MFLIEEFDHHDGAAEGEGCGEERGFYPRESQQHAESVADDGGENDLADAGHDGDLPHVAHLVEAQFETDDEEEEGDTDFRDQLEGVGNLDQSGERADDQSGQHIGHDGRHADPSGRNREERSRHDDESQTAQEKLVGHESCLASQDGGDKDAGCFTTVALTKARGRKWVARGVLSCDQQTL